MVYIYRGSGTPVSTEIHSFQLLCVDFIIPSIHILTPNTKQIKSVWIRSLSLYYYIMSMNGCESDRILLPNHKLMLNFNQWYVKCTAQLRKPTPLTQAEFSSWYLATPAGRADWLAGLAVSGRISGGWVITWTPDTGVLLVPVKLTSSAQPHTARFHPLEW